MKFTNDELKLLKLALANLTTMYLNKCLDAVEEGKKEKVIECKAKLNEIYKLELKVNEAT